MKNFHETLKQLPVMEKLVIGSDLSYPNINIPINLTIKSGLSLCAEMIRLLQRHEFIQEIVLTVDVILTSTGDIEGSIENPLTSSPEWEVLDRCLADPSSFPMFSRLHLIVEIMWSTIERPNKSWTSSTDLCRTVQTRVRAALPQLDAKGALLISAEEMVRNLCLAEVLMIDRSH